MRLVREVVRQVTQGAWIRSLLGRSGNTGGFECLEARQLLAGTPLPDLSDLENSQNAVVRIETNFGDVDIELFNTQAPITVANFLNYVTSGRYDNTFFHRHAIDPNPFVLQGGGFGYTDGGGLTSVSTDSPINRETTGRSNLARTLAMARTNAINSATSQFFINYVDNTFLDPTAPDNGYAVFGRVIQGWDVVTTIQALRSEDLSGDPAFAGDNASAFGEVPVSAAYSEATGVRESVLVNIINAEVVKPSGVSGFFEQRLIMPEGYRSPGSAENLELFNPNTVAATYQVIVHYESGLRDTVVASGTVAPGAKLRVALSDAANTGLNIIRTETPYSVVVETAVPAGTTNVQPIAASINRTDFNSAAGEGFFNPAGYSDAQLRTWDFPRIERNSNSREFISWVNTSDETATITATFFLGNGSTTTRTHTVRAYARGGLALATLGLPDGVHSARITSTQNIVAFLSDFDTPTNPQNVATSYTPGYGVMGLAGGGATAGGLADAVVQAGYTTAVSILNPNPTAATVTLNFWRTGQTTPTTTLVSVLGNRRTDFLIDENTAGAPPAGERFTITYSSGTANVAVQYTSVDEVGRNQSGTKRSDGVSTMFSTRIAPVVHFTDGADIPSITNGSYTETISIFSPYTQAGATMSYTIRYNFSDGTSINAFTGTLASSGRAVFTTQSNATVRNKIQSGNQFRNYSISVIATGTSGSTNTTTAGLVQLTRTDTTNGRSITTDGSASGFGLAFNDDVFVPAG